MTVQKGKTDLPLPCDRSLGHAGCVHAFRSGGRGRTQKSPGPVYYPGHKQDLESSILMAPGAKSVLSHQNSICVLALQIQTASAMKIPYLHKLEQTCLPSPLFIMSL